MPSVRSSCVDGQTEKSMNEPVDTYGVRIKRDHPTLELGTPLGNVSLMFVHKKEVWLSTQKDQNIIINGIGYRVSAQFLFEVPVYGGSQIPVWNHRRGECRLLTRVDYNGYSGEPYTQAAYDTVSKRILPVVCSFLTQAEDMLLLAEKVKINNEIADMDREEEKIAEQLRELRAKRNLLEEQERLM